MDKVTQSNAANAEESAAAAEELNAQAEGMKAAVAAVLKLVGGNDQTTEESTVPASPRSWKAYPAGQAVTGNGNAQADSPKPAKRAPRLETAGVAAGYRRKSENPLEGDSKDF
jgi:methyl-accepting chemotaxis protein